MRKWHLRFGGALVVALACQVYGQAASTKLALGLRVGAARFDADAKKPNFVPMYSGVLSYSLNPHFLIAGEAGYAELKTQEKASFASRIIPVEAELVFRLLPFRKVTPFATLGAGGVWWRATQNGQVIGPPATATKQDRLDSFLKSSGGLTFTLSRQVSLNVGATFRYSLTDALDQIFSGDEKDAVISMFGEVSIKLFSRRGERDDDRDGVLDVLDLDPRTPEDGDGYLDHDGLPENDAAKPMADLSALTPDPKAERAPPIVIHEPVRWAEAGQPLRLHAEIFSRGAMEKIAVLHRERGTTNRMIDSMEKSLANSYSMVLPGQAVHKQGMEYCIVAVDQKKKGLGYSGLPNRPNIIQVLSNPSRWRAATSFVAIIGWGSAAYLAFRRQQ